MTASLILNGLLLFPFRVLPSLFYVRCVGCYPTIFAENLTKICIYQKKVVLLQRICFYNALKLVHN